MKFLLSLLLVGAIALLGSRVTFLDRRLPMGFRSILLTGVAYIFIGAALGRGMGIGLMDEQTLAGLNPFLMFGLCWVGFLFGLQFELKMLRKLPRYYFSMTVMESVITFLCVAAGSYMILAALFDLSWGKITVAALLLGSTASCTAQSAIAIVNHRYRLSNKELLGLLRYISSVDGLMALLFFAATLGLAAVLESEDGSLWRALTWLGVMMITGLVPALILIFLSRVKFSQQEFLVFIVGTVMFAAGLSRELNHSPLISGLICGVLVANLCRHRLRALDMVAHAERSIYIILLLLIGAGWTLDYNTGLWAAAAVYFLTRILGKVLGAYSAVRFFEMRCQVPTGIGLGLISEGGLAIAILLDFKLLYPSLADTLSTLVIISIIASELLGPRLILHQFKRAGAVAQKGE